VRPGVIFEVVSAVRAPCSRVWGHVVMHCISIVVRPQAPPCGGLIIVSMSKYEYRPLQQQECTGGTSATWHVDGIAAAFRSGYSLGPTAQLLQYYHGPFPAQGSHSPNPLPPASQTTETASDALVP